MRKANKKENRPWTVLFFALRLEMLLELIEAIGADALAVEKYNVVGIVAEDTCRMIFLQDDAVIVGEDLDGVLNLDVHGLSDLDRENDSAQLIYFSNHSGGFHNC